MADCTVRQLLNTCSDETLDEAALLSRLFLQVLSCNYNVVSVKKYRIALADIEQGVPVTPCLSHEVQIHSHDLPHVGGYVQHRETGAFIGLVYLPQPKQIIIEEESDTGAPETAEIREFLQRRFVDHDIKVTRLRPNSAYSRAREVAEAHLPLSEVLTATDPEPLGIRLDRLNGIATLMEKESRVSSWGIRTAYGPLAAALAFVLILLFPGDSHGVVNYTVGDWVRIGLLLGFGASFLYFGLKAVQLTKTATRLNKRIREYEFVLAARGRQSRPGPSVNVVSAAESVAPEVTAAIEAELQSLTDPVLKTAALVSARHASSLITDGHSSPSAAPLLKAMCRWRLEVIRALIERSSGELESLSGTSRLPEAVAKRVLLRTSLSTLERKRRTMETYLS